MCMTNYNLSNKTLFIDKLRFSVKKIALLRKMWQDEEPLIYPRQVFFLFLFVCFVFVFCFCLFVFFKEQAKLPIKPHKTMDRRQRQTCSRTQQKCSQSTHTQLSTHPQITHPYQHTDIQRQDRTRRDHSPILSTHIFSQSIQRT